MTGRLASIIEVALSFLVFTVVFAMIYKIVPRVRIDWKDVWIGAATTSLLFTVGKFLIGVYIGRSGIASGVRCSRVSGSGAGVGVLLGPDFLARRGVHARVRAQIRFPQKSPLGGRSRCGLSSGSIPQHQQRRLAMTTGNAQSLRLHLVLAAAMSAVGGFLRPRDRLLVAGVQSDAAS